jgi:hypothetical protein
MREAWPEVAEALASGASEECTQVVASHVARLAGSARKFRRLFSTYAQAPPKVRPTRDPIDWTDVGLRRMLGTVYKTAIGCPSRGYAISSVPLYRSSTRRGGPGRAPRLVRVSPPSFDGQNVYFVGSDNALKKLPK